MEQEVETVASCINVAEMVCFCELGREDENTVDCKNQHENPREGLQVSLPLGDPVLPDKFGSCAHEEVAD